MNLESNKDFGFLRAGGPDLGRERPGNKPSEEEGARTVFLSIDAFMIITLPSGPMGSGFRDKALGFTKSSYYSALC